MGYFRRAWRGEAYLWTTFWLLGPMLLIPTFILIMALPFMFMSSPVIMLAIMVLWIFTVNGYQLICVWRCAFNCKWKGWAYIARILVVFGAVGLLMNVATIGMMAFTAGSMQELVEEDAASTNPDMGAAMKSLEESTKQIEQLQKDIQAQTGEVPPVVEPSAQLQIANPAEAACKDKLRQHAIASGADPEAYVSQNQPWIDGCIQKMTVSQ